MKLRAASLKKLTNWSTFSQTQEKKGGGGGGLKSIKLEMKKGKLQPISQKYKWS